MPKPYIRQKNVQQQERYTMMCDLFCEKGKE